MERPDRHTWGQGAVSLILVSYNARRYLDACLTSLRALRWPDVEVIIVDNASSDGSADHIAAHYPEVVLICAGDNLGFAGGCNRGAQAARGAYLAFLNVDTVVDPDWLAPLVTALDTLPAAGLVTPKILLLAAPGCINTCGNDVHLTGFGTLRGWQQPATVYERPETVASVSGAAFVLRADVFREVGGFDENFAPAYVEDTDLSWRIRMAGYRVYAVPDSHIYHDYQARFGCEKFFCLERNRGQMLLKNLRVRTLLVLLPALLLAEGMSWGFAALHGRRHVYAKLRSYGWLIRHFAAVMTARQRVQRTRRVSDRSLLRDHGYHLGFRQTGSGAAVATAERLFDPLFHLLHRLTLALVRW
jgi:GT2 family glycosyltransferase